MRTTEIWKPIVEYEGYYEVSSLGRVRSLDRQVFHWRGGQRIQRGKILQPYVTSVGRLRVVLCKHGRYQRLQVHRLVLESFVGSCPDGMETCHNNGNPVDNRVTNLRWDTRSGNSYDQVRHGTHRNTRKTKCSKGHEYTPENTMTSNYGDRRCRICDRAWKRMAYHRKRIA